MGVAMKREHKIVVLSIVLAVFAWVADAALDYFVFYQGTFWGLLILDVPTHEVYVRSVISMCVVAFGIVVSRDIGRLAKAEAALQYSEKRFRDFFENAAVGFHILGPKRFILDINRTELDMIGYTRDDIVGKKTWADLIVPEQIEQFERHWQQIVTEGEVRDLEYTLVHKDGRRVDVILNASARFDEHGRLINTRGSAVDITEKKRAGERIKALAVLKEDMLGAAGLDEKLRRITEGVIEILDADFSRIWIIKPGDRCEVGCVHAKVTEGPHVCRDRDRCLHLVASSGRYTHIDGEVHGRVPFGCYKIGRVAAGQESKFVTNDVMHDSQVHDREWAGRLGLVSFAGYRLVSAAGRPIGVLALFSTHRISPEEDALLEGLANTTSQVIQTATAEEEIRTLNEELERRVRERTAELQAVNKELEAFSYSVSHDLQAPLRAINGFSQALWEDFAPKLTGEGKEILDRITGASSRMSQLIDDLLNLSRLSRTELRLSRLDLSELAHAVSEELRQRDPARQVEFVIRPGIMATADAALLRSALGNLLGNAWKFTSKHRSARIEFGVRKIDGQVTYFVRDDGAGFDMTYGDKLFGAFQRLHVPGEFTGSGIGLATVQRIIHRHGGNIWAEGKVEEGATFYFTLGQP